MFCTIINFPMFFWIFNLKCAMGINGGCFPTIFWLCFVIGFDHWSLIELFICYVTKFQPLIVNMCHLNANFCQTFLVFFSRTFCVSLLTFSSLTRFLCDLICFHSEIYYIANVKTIVNAGECKVSQ